MEQLSIPARRQYANQAHGRTADAFETVAWRPPLAHRFDPRPANDGYGAEPAEPTLREEFANLPACVTVAVGGVVAALLGALLGGALHV